MKKIGVGLETAAIENGKNDLDSIRLSIEGHFIKRDISFQQSHSSSMKTKEKKKSSYSVF